MAAGVATEYPFNVKAIARPPRPWAKFFIERDSLELRQFQGFLTRTSPACEVVLSSDAAQAAVLALRRRGRSQILVIQGGLADGRAQQFLEKLQAAGSAPFLWVALADRRHSRGRLEEPRPETLEETLKPSLESGWMLVRFLDPKKPKP